MENYSEYDAMGLSELVAKKEVSPDELLDEALSRAEKASEDLNCVSALFPDIARAQIAEGLPEGPLSGVPFMTKDLGVEVKGAPLTSGSRLFRDFVAERNSTIVERYRKAGIVTFGQTTSPEYGLTTSTESALFGQTRNPWNTKRTSGGSSGGASAAVSSGVLPLAQASDGGGSIRIPSGCTGLFGMKPSRGRIPMGPGRTEGWYGLSTVHAVSRSVRDSAALMDLTMGREIGSRYVAPDRYPPYLDQLQDKPRPLRVALWVNAPNGTKPDVDAHKGLYDTVRLLQDLGHWVEDTDPGLDGALLGKSLVMVIAGNIAALTADRARALGREIQDDDLEPLTHDMAQLGHSVPMAEMTRADAAFQEAAIKFENWMDAGNYDVCLMPTMSKEPLFLGDLSLSREDKEAYTQAVTSFAPHTAVFNMTGCPAMSVPLHWSNNDLPIGMQFGARYGDEGILFRLAAQLEEAKPWFNKRPPVFYD
ncbi:amidase [Ponticaulis sp.]|uniref:amidase n=1 Tax=Ponticaulis sp. TaxID=2020902 RepID=UPI000B7629FD|nr:amidase [Ponticaulis sp.]MAI90447.1 amidase [Ponticaulis sp.]OUY00146.1 MAG: amidase [Hyphomonadaceae bacterium TMED5]|tara:strand:- start:62525 stop:63958 length:1434 start_codon:yes stop_codon:yes gene_type:complete